VPHTEIRDTLIEVYTRCGRGKAEPGEGFPLRTHCGATRPFQKEAVHIKRQQVGLSMRAVREEGPSRNPIGASVTFYETKPIHLEIFP
jgi:hypothetical protein